MSGLVPTDDELASLTAYEALAAKAARLAGDDERAAFRLLDRAFAVHPRRAAMQEAILRRAHVRALNHPTT